MSGPTLDNNRGPSGNDQLQLPFGVIAEPIKEEIPKPVPVVPLPPAVQAPAPAVPDWRTMVPSVSQLTRRIRGHVENAFFDCWVKGEISNFRKPASGHAYFILKDSTAQMRAVMFRGQLSKIKFQVKDGMEVLLHGKITVYEARGEYQIDCDNMEPVGAGALQLAFEQLKAKLLKEGLFDPIHKKKLPFLPKRVGIITSPTGAAVKDILKVLSRRFPDREVLIFPASVQGDKACGEICAAFKQVERWNLENPQRAIEVLIVGRGGGSIEDLWCFNEEPVARAIFACPIPIISAVGHEIDTTIADFVADVRAPTPSAAAEIVLPRKDELTQIVDHHVERLRLLMLRRISQIRLHLGHLSQRLVDPRQRIKNMKEKFKNLEARIQQALLNRLRLQRRRMENLVQLLNSLSPLQVIGRGYTLTYAPDGRLLRSGNQVKPGDALKTRVNDGFVHSTVNSTEKSGS